MSTRKRALARERRCDRNRVDFREFVFTATGADTKLDPFSMLDLQDNLAAELERVEVIAELLSLVRDDLQPETIEIVGTLIKDSVRRLRVIVATAFPPSR